MRFSLLALMCATVAGITYAITAGMEAQRVERYVSTLAEMDSVKGCTVGETIGDGHIVTTSFRCDDRNGWHTSYVTR